MIYYVGAESAAWGEYLKTKLAEADYGIPATLCDIVNCDAKLKDAKPNILLVSPDFAELESWSCFRELNSQQSVAVLLNINTEEFRLLCNEHRHCPELLDWRISEMKSTDDSVRRLLLSIIRIFEGLDSDDSTDEDAFEKPKPSNTGTPTKDVLELEEDPIYDVPQYVREKNELFKVIQDSKDQVCLTSIFAILPELTPVCSYLLYTYRISNAPNYSYTICSLIWV